MTAREIIHTLVRADLETADVDTPECDVLFTQTGSMLVKIVCS